MEDKTSFISRWAQRKSEQQNAVKADNSDEPLSSAVENDAPLPNEEDEVEVLTDDDMPDIETLDDSSDYSQFFSTGVSEELRGLALQKLFQLPEFNLRDGLNDYDDDFSKMPELAEAVASKLRNWVEEQKNAFKEELKDELSDESSSAQPQDQPDINASLDEPEDDELGDADLDG